MRPPRMPPHPKKGLHYFVESIFIITILIHAILLVTGIAGVFIFGVNESLYRMANNDPMVSECVNGSLLSAHILVYSFFALIPIVLVYVKIIEPKLRKDH